MITIRKFTILISLLTLMACSSKPGTNAGGIGSMSGGSVIGNGMSSYSNSLLGVSFSYPPAWRLQESVDKTDVILSNSTVAPPENSSSIEFKRLNKINDTRIYSIDDLSSVLAATYPDKTFQPVKFTGGRKGFSSKSYDKLTQASWAEYFVLDENYNILDVTINAFPDFGGEDIIWDVIGSEVIDTDPPELFDVSVSPSTAKPGEAVTVTIVAIDDASGVDSSYFVAPSVDLRDFHQNWAGYKVKHYPRDIHYDYQGNVPEAPWMQTASDGLRTAYEPASAFPFNTAWTRISKVRYQYSLIVPKDAVGGTVVIANIALKDARGNRISYTLEPYQESGKGQVDYLSTYEARADTGFSNQRPRTSTKIAAASFTILAETKETEALSIQDLFWESSLVNTSDLTFTAELNVKTSHPERLIAAFVDAPIFIPGCQSNPVKSGYYDHEDGHDFVDSVPIDSGGLAPTKLEEPEVGLARLAVNVYGGFQEAKECTGGPFNSANIAVNNLYLRDDTGQIVEISDTHDFSQGEFKLENLGKPVMFQNVWR